MGMEGTVHGAAELASRISDSGLAHACHAQRWFERALQRPVAAADACTLQHLQQRFNTADDMRALLLDVATSAPVRFVRPEVSP
jgi:hypothetical protein